MDYWVLGIILLLFFILLIEGIIIAFIGLYRTPNFTSNTNNIIPIPISSIGVLTAVQQTISDSTTAVDSTDLNSMVSPIGLTVGPLTAIVLAGLINFASPVTTLNLTFSIKTTTDNVDKRNTVFVFSNIFSEDVNPPQPFQKQTIQMSTGVVVNVSMKITIPSIYLSKWGLNFGNVPDDTITDTRTYVISNFKITGS